MTLFVKHLARLAFTNNHQQDDQLVLAFTNNHQQDDQLIKVA